MNIFYWILFILLLVLFLAFTIAFKIAFTLDTKKENVKLVLLWMYPFMKIVAEGNAATPQLSLYFFRKKVYSKQIHMGKKLDNGHRAGIIKAASPSDIDIDIDYGFRDPFVTGVTCGSIGAASEMADISIRQYPDFITDVDYIYLNATANVNAGRTMLNYFRARAGKY